MNTTNLARLLTRTLVHTSSPVDADRVASKSVVTYFDGHADYYERSQYRTGRRTFMNARHEQILTLLTQLSIPSDASVLDAGCGPGNLVPALARYRRLCAMDASPRMLHIARANSAEVSNVAYQVGSIDSLPYGDATFDLVCSAGVIEYLRDWERALREMHRVLRPGGMLILPTTNALAPAHWLRPILEPVARIPFVARAFGIQPGTYQLWYHRIAEFKGRLRNCGFELERERHFYLTLPRPLDRLFPRVANRVEALFDAYMNTPVRHLAEGYIAVARKKPSSLAASSTGQLL
jgi:SAM-dependent methyltransferase